MEHADSEQLSVFSAYLKEKISEKGWSVKEFGEMAGFSEKYAYRLVSPKRDFIPLDETIDKILKALELREEEGQYIVDLILLERQADKPVYPGHPGLPVPPVSQGPAPEPEPQQPESPDTEPGESQPEPSTPEPGPSEPQQPDVPPEPQPPGPPVPVPGGQMVWFKRRDVMVALFVGMVAGLLIGCCGMWGFMQLFFLGNMGWGF